MATTLAPALQVQVWLCCAPRRRRAAEALELGFPKVIRLDGVPGGFNQHIAQFFAAFFGNVTGAMRLPAVVHAGGQPAVAHQFLGRGKAGDTCTCAARKRGASVSPIAAKIVIATISPTPGKCSK
jgi:hypothetical protein